MEFSCSSCDYTSKYKCAVAKHINRKNKCSENPQIVTKKTEEICSICNLPFKNKEELDKHFVICKDKKDYEEEQKIFAEDLKNLNERFKDIKLTPYNNPVLPDNIFDIYDEMTTNFRGSFSIYLKNVHFNPDYPQNYNIYIDSLDRKYSGRVYNGTTWEIRDKDKLVKEILDNIYNQVTEWVMAVNYIIEKKKKSAQENISE